MWYKLAKHEVRQIDPEEDWEEAEQGERVFRVSSIRCSRDKNISHVAVENDEVIGSLSSGWCFGNYDDGESVAIYSWDLAVLPEHRRKGVGKSLIDAAFREYNNGKNTFAESYGRTMMRIWVINPHLFDYMESLGFEEESQHGDGSRHYVYYG